MSLKEHFELMAEYNQWMNEKVYDAAGGRFPLRTPAQHGKIPLLELDSGETHSESNAILNYLASGSDLYPHHKNRDRSIFLRAWQRPHE